jgi:hypothetical protein
MTMGRERQKVSAGAQFPEGRASCMPDRDPDAPLEPTSPDLDELENDALELDDPIVDEAAFPELDREDAEAALREPGYDDLIDRGWLERTADEDWDDERSTVEDIGLTIDLDSSPDDDEGAQVVDLDVGSLLTSLPSEGTELDLEPNPLERGDASIGLGVLRDVLLPEDDDEDEHDDREVGDDARFPVFDPDAERSPRSLPDEEPEIGPDDLS